nr:hemagglutinin repeat-containing protein [Pseudomonas sp. BF-R-01]
MWAQADGIVVATPGTTLDNAGNGMQIVNIATPNGSGLSHNQFHDYNVSAQGLILNNGSAQTSLTQMGGIIIGNPNLKNSGSAQTILNEVIGGSPSQLRGYTEVAGQSAHVIVANPYGITCNGCGFINTPRVTLTTGKPVLDGAGRVDHFQVDQGSIAIEGAGLNASNIDQFDLITRSATINANLYAKKLNVITGRNNVDATSLSAKPLAADGSTAPMLAIDSSALGGMYAGAIKLVGTEQGVGVKLGGEMATSAGDLNLDVNGKLTLATTGASGALTVKAQSVQADGPLYAGGNLNVTASEDLFNQKSIAAGGNVMLASNGQLTNLGIIEAGINADNTHNLTGDVQIDAKNLRNAGQVIAARKLTANVEKDFDNRKGLMSANAALAKVTVGGRLDNTEGTLQAKTDLVVSGATVINQNGAMLGKAVTVTATHLDNSQQGRVVADSGALTVTVDQAVNNQQGRLQATAGDVALKAGSVDNRAGVVVGQKVAVTTTSGNLDNRAGQVLGNRLEVDAKTAVDNRDSGQLLAGSDGLKLKAKGLQNQQGNITAGGSHAELDLGQGRLDNQSGTLSASSVSLTAGDVDNSGGSLVSLAGNLQLTVDRLINQGGLIESSQKLQLDGQSLDNSAGGRLLAHFGDLSRIALQNELDNRGGHIAIGSDNFVLQAGTLRNGAGQIEHAATGQFSVNTASLFSAQGRLVGLGSGDWNITNVDGIGLWHVNGALDISGLQSIALQAGDRIASASSLSLDAVSLSNAGELLSDGDLTLKLSGNLTNQGLISTQQALKIKAVNVTQNDGRIASAGNGELVLSGTLDNLGRLTSSANLSVVADRIDNGGTLGAQQLLTLSATRDINNRADSLIFSGADMTLRADSLLNRYADFYSKGKLSFAARDGGKASLLINRSGSIESGSDIDIKVRELINEKAEFEATQSIASRRIVINCTDCSGGTHSGYYIVRTLYEGSILKDSPASRLLANQDLLLDAVTVTNGQSLLAANRHTTITASNFYNRGFTLDNREENINYFLDGVSKSTYRVTEAATNAWNDSYAGQPLASQAPIPIEVTKYPIENITNTIMPGNNTTHVGTVQAGGALKLNVSGELVNGSLTNQGNAQLIGATLDSQAFGAGGQQIILASPVGSPGPLKDVKRIETVAVDGSVKVSFVPVDFTGAAFVGIDPTSLPSFRLPQGSYGLFTQSRNPANKYLIETNPSFVDLSKFMSSDYLIGKLGYDPDQAARRLGDGRYETRLIADAVRAQTGQRFLADGLSSDYEQFQYLMDNAISSKNALNLSVGVMLTSQQVAALTHDIVWMEERVINGETVLVPVLYLAKVDSRNLRGGSLIQGRNVEIITGGDLKNVGTLRASEDLSALSGGSILQGGLAQANANLTLLAQDSIRNAMAGEIRADKVNLTSLKGDIVNDRTATTFNIGAGSATQLDAGSSISAGSKLTINAANNLTSKGRISSGGDATLTAGNDINLLAVEDRTVTRDALRRGMRTEETLTQLGSSVTAAGNLTLHAGRDLNSVASKASAGKDLNASADGDINLISAEDEHNLESRYKKGNKKVHEIDDQTRQVASEFSAGGNLSVKAAGDVTLLASNLSAGNEAYLAAGKDLLIRAAQDEDYRFFNQTKKTSSSKKSLLEEIFSTTNVGSLVTAQGKTVLSAGNDLLIEGSSVISEKGGVGLAAGNDVKVVAVTDSTSARHESSSSKSSWGGFKSSKVKDALSESQTTAVGSLISGDTIAVSAKRDAAISGSVLVSTDDLAVRAGRDLLITAAENTYTRTEAHKEKNRDLTGVLTGNKLGVDDITGNQHLSISGQRHNGTMSQTTLTGSTIGSSNGNVSLVAGGDLSVVASDLISTKNMSLRGTNVTIAAGIESSSQSTTDQTNSLAVGRVIGGAVIDTVNTIRTSVKAANDTDDPRLKAVKFAQAALAAYNLYGMKGETEANSTGFKDKVGGTSNNGSLIKIGTELANSHSKSTSAYFSQTAKQSSANAGGTLSIVATGGADGEPGNIHVIGSALKATDTSLIAKNDITLESAQNTADWANNTNNNKTAIGASFNIGQQNGFTLDLGAQAAKNMGTGSSVTQVNSTVNTGSLLLRSGGDTTLAGAQVNAESINALIDGNLNIISRQDVETQDSKQSSGGIGASICIPPFCYGTTVAGSVNLAAGSMSSEYKAVTEQSGLFAGSGGYTIDVGKNTSLTGGVIASNATPDKNLLITDRLIVSNIKNVSEVDAKSAGISASFGSAGGGSGSVGGLYGIALSDSDQSKTRSAVSEGTIIVRNPQGANDLVGLNRDTANANERLDKPDLHAMDERIELVKSATQLAKGIGDAIAAAKIKEGNDLNSEAAKAAKQKLNDKGYADPTPEQIAQQVQYDYGTGSSFQKASQAVSAIVQGVLSGNILGAFAGGSAPYLAQAVKQMTEGDDTANLMAHALLGAVLAKAQGGSALAGATGAGIGELIAQQLYSGKTGEQLTESEKQTVSALSTLAGGLAGAMVTGNSAGAALGAWTSKNAVENNHLSVIENVSLGMKQKEYDASCKDSASSYCQGLSNDIAGLIAKGLSVLKNEEVATDSDFTRAFVFSTNPGDIISCATSGNGYCVVTNKSVTTDQGEEWVLQPASYEQSIIGETKNKLEYAEATARLQGVSNELFMAGCGGAGIVGIGCQSFLAAGGANPITGESASGSEQVMWGVGALLNAWGLFGSVYTGGTKVAVDAAALNASWMPKGITTAATELPVGRQLIGELQASGMTFDNANRYANGFLQSGADIPVAQTINSGDRLVKIVPSGTSPSTTTGYWTTTSALDAEMQNTTQLGSRFGLPPSTANAKSYDIYQITPKGPATVFESTIAGTQNSITGVTQGGGALQVIVPNRSLFTSAELVGKVSVH